ncbi:MAG: carboxyl transferase domain-containing protein [Azospirillaceae bacterium]
MSGGDDRSGDGWQKEVDDLARRRLLAQGLGGDAAVARQHAAGKLTVRERIDALVDPGSFHELGALAGSARYDGDRLTDFTPTNSVVGTGRSEGRKLVVSADDYTVRAGSSESAIAAKWLYAEKYALEMRLPLVRLVETAGGSVRLLDKAGATKIPGYADWRSAELLGTVPVVGVAMGACAGLGAFKVAASHFSVMVKRTSQVFAAGPHLVKAGTGVEVDKEALGGAEVHTRGSGLVDNAADDEADALAQVRRFLSYLPRSVHELPPVVETDDPSDRADEALLSIVPRQRRKIYDMRRLLSHVFDRDSLFEIAPGNGRSVIAMLGRLAGRPVGVIGNDPRIYGGGLSRGAAEKMETFVDLCDTFHLPIVTFVDQPGVLIGPEAEKAGTFRAAVRLLGAIEQSRVPWTSIIVRRLFGVAGSAYGRLGGLNLHFAWPSARWGSLPLEGGVYAAHRREIEAAEDPGARLAELTGAYEHLSSPFRTAERFGVPDIIDPRRTRPILCDWIEDAYRLLPEQLGPRTRTMRR